METDHEISTVILPPSTDSRMAVVSHWQKCVPNLVLVNRLEDYRKKVSRLINQLDMTL